MTKFTKLFFLLILGGLTALNAAVTSTITVPGVDTTALKAEIDKSFQTANTSQVIGLLDAMAAGQAAGAAGAGSDYSSNKSIFVVGGGANVGFNPGNNSLSDLSKAFDSSGLPSIGVAAQVSGFVGMSLASFPVPTIGPIDLKRLTIFANFGAYEATQIKPFTAKTSNFGLHVQYKLIEPKSLGLGFLNWGGVDIGTGFDIASNKFSTSGSLSEQKSGNLSWKPTGTVALNSNAFVIPIEASTSVRLLYVLSLIGGAGVDIMSSSSDLTASLSGPVSLTVNGVSSTAGSAAVTGSEVGKGGAVGIRGFGGFAFNIVPLKNTNVLSVFVIANAGTIGYGVRVGIQGAF